MYSPDTKAAVVSALLTGLAISEVARQFGVSRQTAIRWREEAFAAIPDTPSPHFGQIPDTSWIPIRGTDWQDNFQRYVDDSLYSMRVQVAYLARPDVLERTDYAAIVDAHGTLADRVARIADTIGRVEGRDRLDGQPARPGPAGVFDDAATAEEAGAAG